MSYRTHPTHLIPGASASSCSVADNSRRRVSGVGGLPRCFHSALLPLASSRAQFCRACWISWHAQSIGELFHCSSPAQRASRLGPPSMLKEVAELPLLAAAYLPASRGVTERVGIRWLSRLSSQMSHDIAYLETWSPLELNPRSHPLLCQLCAALRHLRGPCISTGIR